MSAVGSVQAAHAGCPLRTSVRATAVDDAYVGTTRMEEKKRSVRDDSRPYGMVEWLSNGKNGIGRPRYDDQWLPKKHNVWLGLCGGGETSGTTVAVCRRWYRPTCGTADLEVGSLWRLAAEATEKKMPLFLPGREGQMLGLDVQCLAGASSRPVERSRLKEQEVHQ